MGFKEQLREHLKNKIDYDDLKLLPSGFQTIGKAIILKLHEDLEDKTKLIAKACLELMPYINAVYVNTGKIEGKFREPTGLKLIVGENQPEVLHKENGVTYKFDLTKIMFSKGNLHERKHLASLVQDDEIILDMFAGIGYFSLSIGKHANPKRIYCIEINPIAYKYLVENIKINDLEDKIIPIHGDCKEETLKLSEQGVKADRVIMGVFPAPKGYIEEALSVISEKGTIYHYEGVVEEDDELALFEEFSSVVKKHGFKTELKDKRFVKSYGPRLYHGVYDIFVYKSDDSEALDK